MKKDKSYELYQLIQSLTPAEKKFIRRQLSKYDLEQTKELLLFDLFNIGKEPEDDELKKGYIQKKYSPEYLPADKNKLYEAVLEGLSDLNAAYSNEIKANEGLQKAIVLYEKKLFEQCHKQILKVKKQAYLFELWGLYISLLHLEQRCHGVMFQFDLADAVMQEEFHVFGKQQLLNQYASIHYESISLRVKIGKARSGDQLANFDLLIEKLYKLEKSDDFYPQFNRLETFCNYYFVKDELQQEMKFNADLISLMQKNPWYIDDNPLNYIAVRTRLLGIQRRISSELFWGELPVYRQLPKQLSKQKQTAEVNVFIFSHNLELDQLLLEKNWDKAFQLIEPMERGIAKYSEQIDSNWLISAVFRFAYASIFSSNFEKALDYILKVLNEFPASIRPDMNKVALLLQILIHFELGNYRLLSSLIANTKYQLRKNEQLFGCENLILGFFGRISKNKDDNSGANLQYQEFITNLKKLKQDTFEKKIFEIFDFEYWASKKLDMLKSD
jgi:hypothetical protein